MSELNNAIVDLAGKINQNNLSNADYIIKKAKEPWKKDPFVQTHGPLGDLKKADVDKQSEAGPSSILFTGFIHVGDKMIAIINGQEYEEGDIIGNGIVLQVLETNSFRNGCLIVLCSRAIIFITGCC